MEKQIYSFPFLSFINEQILFYGATLTLWLNNGPTKTAATCVSGDASNKTWLLGGADNHDIKKKKKGEPKKTENKKRENENITEKKEIRRNQKDNICNSLF